MEVKICKGCNFNLPLFMYYITKGQNGKEYYRNTCIECEREKSRRYERDKQRHKDPERKQYQKDYRADEEHREKANLRAKIWREENPERAKENIEIWVENNKERVKELHRIKARERKANDPKFHIKTLLRNRLNKAFKRYSKNGKVKPSREYGIDYEAIFIHLGPKPDSIHNWEIDHIIPLVSFNFDDPEQVKKAFAPENHQWLIKEDNVRKGDKLKNIDKFTKKSVELRNKKK